MKKTIVGTLSAIVLLSSFSYANATIDEISISPVLYSSSELKDESLKNLIKKHELVIRNNVVKIEREYNNSHYFTKKIDTSDIMIPEDLKEKANDIYFLIEEGRNPIMYVKQEAMADGLGGTNKIEDVYNYKKVTYKGSKKEYLFSTKDLVKELKEDEYKSVTITLIAEFDNNERINLSNSEYLSINSKESILQNLTQKENEEELYFSKYNSDDIEIYLEKKSEKMSRDNYRKMITSAGTKIDKMVKSSNDKKEALLKNIKKESDFTKKLDEYKALDETLTLLRNLHRAVKSQIYNVKTFDAIDAVLK